MASLLRGATPASVEKWRPLMRKRAQLGHTGFDGAGGAKEEKCVDFPNPIPRRERRHQSTSK